MNTKAEVPAGSGSLDPLFGIWQPMETAPLDKEILLAVNAPVIGKWNDDKYAKKPRPFWCWDWSRVTRCRENPPTAWMPLPSMPNGPGSASVPEGDTQAAAGGSPTAEAGRAH